MTRYAAILVGAAGLMLGALLAAALIGDGIATASATRPLPVPTLPAPTPVPTVELAPTVTATPTAAPLLPAATPTPVPTVVIPLVTHVGVPPPAGSEHYDRVQRLIFNRFEQYGQGARAVRVAYFEGYNEVTQWTTDYIRAGADACVMQINQIHDDNPNSAIRRLYGDQARWPGPVLHLDGCLRVAEQVFLDDLANGGDGWGPWSASRGKWADPNRSIYNPAGTPIPHH